MPTQRFKPRQRFNLINALNGGGGGGTLWTPNDDPDLLLWYDADSYTVVNHGAYSSYRFDNKRTGYTGSTYRQVPIGVPTSALDCPQLEVVDGVATLRYRTGGTKCTTTFSVTGMDCYLVFKPTSQGGAYTRFVDNDYGNGYWLGSMGSGNVGGGVRDGSNPYGVSLAGTSGGWGLLNISRVGSATAYRVTLNADTRLSGTRTGTSGATTANPIALGAELGGNNAVPDLYISAFFLYSSSTDDHQGDNDSIDAKRQGYIHHTYGLPYSLTLISNSSHRYYTNPPYV